MNELYTLEIKVERGHRIDTDVRAYDLTADQVADMKTGYRRDGFAKPGSTIHYVVTLQD